MSRRGAGSRPRVAKACPAGAHGETRPTDRTRGQSIARSSTFNGSSTTHPEEEGPLPGFDAVAPVTRRWTSVFFGHPSSLCPFCLQRVTRERERRGMSMKRVRSPEWRMPVQLIKPTLLPLQPRIWSFLSSDWWIGCLFSLLSLLSLSRPSKMWKLRILII